MKKIRTTQDNQPKLNSFRGFVQIRKTPKPLLKKISIDTCEYISRLKDKQIYNFCAIPQVMAIATLALCYSNYSVFTGVVKIRRGQTAKIIVGIRYSCSLTASLL